MTSLVQDAMDEVAKDVKAYGTDVVSAAASAGTISGVYCGDTPVGPIGSALQLFVESTAYDVLFLGARAAKSVNGALEATGYYVIGDEENAARAHRGALSVPKIDMPGDGKGDGQK